MERINIGGIFFNNLNMKDAIETIENLINIYRGGRTRLLCFANQDVVSTFSGFDKKIIKSLNDESIILPDGQSIVIAAKLLGKKITERVPGPDFIYKFIESTYTKKYRHFFLGAKEGVGKMMADNFLRDFPELKISGIYSPPFGDFTDEENKKMIDLINGSKTDLLWVSFGCPKQEKWVLKNIGSLKVPVSACIGAAFNFHAGINKRAPVLFQKTGFEWLYRLFQEPGRLWKRYFLGGLNFICLIIKQKLSGKSY